MILKGLKGLAKFIARITLRVAVKIAKIFFTGKWQIAIFKSKGPVAGNCNNGKMLIKPPKDRFYADPFIIKMNDINYVFFEDYIYTSKKGVISCIVINENGITTEYTAVLEKDYHLSYPCIFEWENDIYMIPETLENRTVELYKAINFPFGWALERTLIDNIEAVDPTILMKDGLYWLFVGVPEDGVNFNQALNLYYSDSLSGQWTPHPCNPVVTGISRSRPAGSLFYEKDRLMRPSQDCSISYGGAIWINQVEELSKTGYREIPVRKICPCTGGVKQGTHTINFSEDFEVTDYKAIVSKFYNKSK